MNMLVLLAAAMFTAWGEKMTPETAWRDYPRPQMVRDNWTCLNGEWDYAVASRERPERMERLRGRCVPRRLQGLEVLRERTLASGCLRGG